MVAEVIRPIVVCLVLERALTARVAAEVTPAPKEEWIHLQRHVVLFETLLSGVELKVRQLTLATLPEAPIGQSPDIRSLPLTEFSRLIYDRQPTQLMPRAAHLITARPAPLADDGVRLIILRSHGRLNRARRKTTYREH